MQGRERWQALQARLGAARGAVARGDRDSALAEIAAALELDPDFLAAQELRDRLLADAAAAPVAPVPAAAEEHATAAPDVSTDGYARFQQRTKRRRLENRMEAARDAIKRGRVTDAAAALDEVIELDPKLPELFPLTEAFDALRRGSPPHRGPWLVAAAVFACMLLGASWLHDSSSLISRPVMTAGVMLPGAVPNVTVSMDFPPVATSGVQAATETSDAQADVAPGPADVALAPEAPAPARAPVDLAELPLQVPAAVVQAPPRAEPALRLFESPRAAPSTVAAREPEGTPSERNSVESTGEKAALQEPVVDESALIQKALQRYRLAYEQLDAQSAQAVWPAVNQAALARAFDGLESQALVFDVCNLSVSGDAAAATCRGSARYVPKVGSREPRVESRVWSFTLRKNGSDWKIDSARAER
jgi:tetratricopeptide (TPR) repeat protein